MGSRIVAAGVALTFALLATWQWFIYLVGESPGSDTIGMAGLAIMAMGAGAVAQRFAFHPRLIIDGRDLVIVNPLRTHRVPLQRIRLAETTSDGLQLLLDDNTSVAVWAVQTMNLTRWLGGSGRGDEVIEALKAAGAPLPPRHRRSA